MSNQMITETQISQANSMAPIVFLSKGAETLLIYLRERRVSGLLSRPTYDIIAEQCQMGRHTIRRAFKELEAQGYLVQKH